MPIHEAIVHIIASCLVRDSDFDWLSLLDEAWCGILNEFLLFNAMLCCVYLVLYGYNETQTHTFHILHSNKAKAGTMTWIKYMSHIQKSCKRRLLLVNFLRTVSFHSALQFLVKDLSNIWVTWVFASVENGCGCSMLYAKVCLTAVHTLRIAVACMQYLEMMHCTVHSQN